MTTPVAIVSLSKSTPIKIRGKKHSRPSSPIPSNPQKKRVIEVPQRAPRKRSHIEYLPFEIIELIFFECLNVNLLRAAPLIGITLSDHSTYRKFCRRAFCLHLQPELPLNTLDEPLALENCVDRGIMRTLALQSRWATLQFLERFVMQMKGSKRFLVELEPCKVPQKLLKWPLTKDERRFFLLLASSGAKVDPINSLDGEKIEILWRGATLASDLPLMRCLMNHPIDFRPNLILRRWAVEVNNFYREVVRVLWQASIDHCKAHGCLSKSVSRSMMGSPCDWPADWTENWPESDPVLTTKLYHAWNLKDHTSMRSIIRQNRNVAMLDWRDTFGSIQHGVPTAI